MNLIYKGIIQIKLFLVDSVPDKLLTLSNLQKRLLKRLMKQKNKCLLNLIKSRKTAKQLFKVRYSSIKIN